MVPSVPAFLGAGGRLASAGPGLFLVYGICGIFVFLICALGELVLHRPSPGVIRVHRPAEVLRGKGGLRRPGGCTSFLNWAMTRSSIPRSRAIAAILAGRFNPSPSGHFGVDRALLVVLSTN